MPAAPDVVIGVDIGTTSTKAVAFDADGNAHASASHGYPLSASEPGRAEQDASQVADAACDATRETAAQAAAAGHAVAGIAFSAAMHSLVALDANANPITPLITWADNRAIAQAARLRDQGEALALHQRTGTPVHPMSPMVKLRWFADEQPRTTAKAAHWAGIKELLLHRLTGELVTDHGVASATGLFNLAAGDWDEQALAYARIAREQLPRPVPTTTTLSLTSTGAARLGVAQGTPLVIGGSDGPLANLGLGAIRHGTVACSLGTSGAVRVAADSPMVDPRGRSFCYVLAPGRYVIGGAVNNGGIVLQWLGDAVAPDIAEAAGAEAALRLLDEAAKAPAGSERLLFLPYLLGERAPHWSGDPRAVYLGLTREHRREHLLRAAIEGVSLQLAVVLNALAEAGAEIGEIRATGGFSRSALLRRILASAFGRPIGFARSPEGSALGAALLGMTALGMLDSLDRAAEIVTVTHTEQPDRDDAAVYAQLLPVFDGAFEALAPTFTALAKLQEEQG